MTKEQKEKIKWLNRAFRAEKKLGALYYHKERDKGRAVHITAAYGGNIKGKSDSRENAVEKAFITFSGSTEKYDRFLDNYISIRGEIEKSIESLHDDEIEAIFTYRYLDYLTMEKIAEKMHYDKRTIIRKHKEGIEKLSPNVTLCH